MGLLKGFLKEKEMAEATKDRPRQEESGERGSDRGLLLSGIYFFEVISYVLLHK